MARPRRAMTKNIAGHACEKRIEFLFARLSRLCSNRACKVYGKPRRPHAPRNGPCHGAAPGFVPLALSRQEIAGFVGTTVESAIRVMSKWNREGLLVTGRDRFVIPDRERLRAGANVGDEE